MLIDVTFSRHIASVLAYSVCMFVYLYVCTSSAGLPQICAIYFKIYIFFITEQAFVLLATLYMYCTAYLKCLNSALLLARSHLFNNNNNHNINTIFNCKSLNT